MYKYKRGINDLGKIKNIQVTFTNGIDTSYSMFSTLEARKIYNGMYIKDKKVLLENLIEKVEIGDKTYRIGQVDTKVKAISSDEYITLVDLEKNKISYELGSLKYTKKICFDIKDTKALVIEYDIENETDTKAIFNVLPFVTYRDIFDVKTSNVLRFNSRETSNSTFLNLSVTNKVNLSLKSIGMEWLREKSFIKSVKHEYINQNLIKDTYEEDLCIPGRFILEIDPKEKKKVYILVSDVDLDETKLVPDKIFDNLDKYNTEIVNNIDESFVELIELTTSIQNNNISDSVVATIPYSIKLDDISKIISDDNKKESIEMLLEYQDVVKSIEGKYLSLGQIKEAKKLLLDVKSKIGVLDSKNIQDVEILENILALKLWTVESINRLMQKDTTLNLFFDFVKDTIYLILKNPNLKTITYNSIELVSLFYNTLKIYQNMLIALKQDDASV